MCGEEAVGTGCTAADWGSPPHVRGRVRRTQQPPEGAGITPACAGKRRSSAGCCASSGDHPRMCGEEAVVKPYVQSKTGSPPHVRGRAGRVPDYCRMPGITPACAGKRPCGIVVLLPAGDHPRMCGEEAVSMIYAFADEGSPPHVRGRGGGFGG